MAIVILSKSALFTAIGFGVAAATCMGLVAFSAYFFLGRFLMYSVAALLLGLAVAGGSNFRLSSRSIRQVMPIALWAGLMYLLTLALIVASPTSNSGTAIYLLNLTTMALASAAMLVILSTQVDISSKIAGTIFRNGFLVSALLVILDPVLDIRSMVPGFSADLYERTRAAGLYLQPNLAGTVLPFFFLTLLPRISKAGVLLCAAALILATFLTFSRSSMLLTSLVLLVAIVSGKLPLRIVAPAALVLLLFGSDLNPFGLLSDVFQIDSGSGFVRLMNLADMLSLGGVSSDSRVDLFNKSLDDFFSSPLTGYGPGFSWEWAEINNQGTHNIYLRYMLEYGIIGSIFWPLLILALYKSRNPNLPRVWALLTLFSGFFIGFFSHNLPEQSSVLIVIAAAFTLPIPAECRTRDRKI